MSLFDNIMNTVNEVKDNLLNNNSNNSSNNLSMLAGKDEENNLASSLLEKIGINTNDGILDQVSSFFGGKSEHITKITEQLGEIGGLKDLLTQNGLAEQVQSWIGSGENLPVSAEQIQQALDTNGILSNLAEKANVTKEQASGLLADILPNVIDKITPNGSIPEGGFDFSALVKQFIKI